MKIICTNCKNEYQFKDAWLKKNDPKIFVCRACKLNKIWSDKDRSEASKQSKDLLADNNIKERMSIKASLNNQKNAEKISKSLKGYYTKNPKKAQEIGERSKKLWEDEVVAKKIKDKIKEKWKDEDYRNKIFSARWNKAFKNSFNKLTKKEKKIKSFLDQAGMKYELDYCLGTYKFKFFVEGKILIDTENSQDKKLFIEHYFPQYQYTVEWK